MASQEPQGIFYLSKITGNFKICFSGSCSRSLRYALSLSLLNAVPFASNYSLLTGPMTLVIFT